MDPQRVLGGRLRHRALGPIREVCEGRRGPNRVQYALKENEERYGGCLKAQMGTARSVEVKQSLHEGQNPSLRGLCEGRENRGSTTTGEAPGSLRGLTRVQYPYMEGV